MPVNLHLQASRYLFLQVIACHYWENDSKTSASARPCKSVIWIKSYISNGTIQRFEELSLKAIYQHL